MKEGSERGICLILLWGIFLIFLRGIPYDPVLCRDPLFACRTGNSGMLICEWIMLCVSLPPSPAQRPTHPAKSSWKRTIYHPLKKRGFSESLAECLSSWAKKLDIRPGTVPAVI